MFNKHGSILRGWLRRSRMDLPSADNCGTKTD
jgi:hypothetical protein